jgi:drug/metabolite transporter (DMT)-like permease
MHRKAAEQVPARQPGEPNVVRGPADLAQRDRRSGKRKSHDRKIARRQQPAKPPGAPYVAAIGFFDLRANLLFVLATGRGLLSVVGVLAALYPAVTVLLARAVLRERLPRARDAGVLVTLAGVIAPAAGA